MPVGGQGVDTGVRHEAVMWRPRVQHIAALIALIELSAIAPAASVGAQAPNADPPAVQDLLKQYTDQLTRRPDSALATLRAVLPGASREDSDDVSRYALIEGNRLYRRMNNTPRLDSLTSNNLDTHVDSLSMTIQYLSLSDSVRSTAETSFFLSVSYYYRARAEAVLAQRTDNCSEWWAVHNDATRSQQYASRRNPGGRALDAPKSPYPSLLDYADDMLKKHCDKGPKAAT